MFPQSKGNISSRKMARTLEKQLLPEPGSNGTLGVVIISQVSKYHSLVKGTRVLGAGIDLRSGVGKIQNEHGIFYDARK